MQEITMQPQEEGYPIIEAETYIEWGDGEDTEIRSLFVDEDGNTQLRVVDTHPNTPTGTHTISIGDLYERMNFQRYKVIKEQ